MGSPDARFMHVFSGIRPKDGVASTPLPKPRFVTAEDASWARLGLGFLIDGLDQHGAEGVTACTRTLNQLVDLLWQRIKPVLSRVDRRSTVEALLENHESIKRDAEQWAHSSRALNSLYQDATQVVQVAADRERKRNQTSLGCRVLIEMAVCTSPDQGGREIDQSTIGGLLADVLLLIELANQSDAILFELAIPGLHVAPRGDVRGDGSFVEGLLSGYQRDSFASELAAASKAYDLLFDDRPDNRSLDDLIDKHMSQAFQAEFGLSFVDFLEGIYAIEKDTVERQDVVSVTQRSALVDTLAEAGLTAPSAENLLDMLTLPCRERWDEPKPRPFRARDWYPWRYRRRLSLLVRPLVPVSGGSNPELAYGIALLETCAGLMTDRIMNGSMSEEFFTSPQMRAWIGGVNDSLGAGFEELVRERFRELGWNARRGVEMSELGASATLGDIDVVAWHESSETLWIVECKRVRFARTIGEIGEQLRRFRGEATDELGKHLARIAWLLEHPESLQKLSKKRTYTIEPLLVSSSIVPMSYVADLPLDPEHILALEFLQTVVPSARPQQ